MAAILAFPPAKRVAFVRKQANYVLSLSQQGGERHVGRTLAFQRQCLLSKGVAENQVDAAVAELEWALRAAIWRRVFTPEAG